MAGQPFFDLSGSAFPDSLSHEAGITKRDYFAAHARDPIPDDAEPQWVSERSGVPVPSDPAHGPHWAAFWAQAEAALRYRYADAMLAERSKRRTAS